MASLKLYRSYMFRSKDPVIDEMRTMVQDEYGELSYTSLRGIEDQGGPSKSCMAAWFFGDTKRPQSASIEAAGRAMGYRRQWVKMKKGG